MRGFVRLSVRSLVSTSWKVGKLAFLKLFLYMSVLEGELGGALGMDGGLLPLPSRSQRRCDPASLVFLITEHDRMNQFSDKTILLKPSVLQHCECATKAWSISTFCMYLDSYASIFLIFWTRFIFQFLVCQSVSLSYVFCFLFFCFFLMCEFSALAQLSATISCHKSSCISITNFYVIFYRKPERPWIVEKRLNW